MFRKVLVANRGAVASRVIRALRSLHVQPVAVYSDADAGAPYLAEADECFAIGPGPARESYLNQDAVLHVLKSSGADAVHPGYGFLAENPFFARRVQAAGAQFIGPSSKWLEAMGQKTAARELMARHGMPMAPGSSVLASDDEAILSQARAVGFPILVKPVGGGGGIGMISAADERALEAAVEKARSLAQRAFATTDIYFERLLEESRHIEFQILGDQHGGVRHIFERDCSVQRRHQKLIEEAPAPLVDRATTVGLADRLASILQKLGYDNIGTIEMLRDKDGSFSFLEMNTRLQVEHAVTEAITSIDLVVAQIRAAAGERLGSILPAVIERCGHAIEARVCAEDPWTHYPSPGMLQTFRPPLAPDVRIESGYAEGRTITTYYDSLLAKVIIHAPTREQAIDKLDRALGDFAVEGVKTNIEFLRAVLGTAAFRSGAVHTSLGSTVLPSRRKMENG
jgi:acetyl-CoA carboxylase biotin carboxylase subunit